MTDRGEHDGGTDEIESSSRRRLLAMVPVPKPIVEMSAAERRRFAESLAETFADALVPDDRA